MMGVFSRRRNQLNFGLYCRLQNGRFFSPKSVKKLVKRGVRVLRARSARVSQYAYVHFVIGFFPFFAPLEPLGLIIVRHFLKKCGNAAMPRSGKNTVLRACSTSISHLREI